MHAIYSAESHTFKKDVPQDFSKCMKAYHFLSVHPKFEIKITIYGSKPQSKNPNALVSANIKQNDQAFVNTDVSASFVAHLCKKCRPSGRETVIQ